MDEDGLPLNTLEITGEVNVERNVRGLGAILITGFMSITIIPATATVVAIWVQMQEKQ
ncbi:hypothetical protein [Neobacillus novalis]|uniref:hypothetical protein n=1 Tax=Neobacillus novalis TaxID=220687 RepID=UPI000A505F9B|nr:hypothetical protein [Neobacillus novalis]